MMDQDLLSIFGASMRKDVPIQDVQRAVDSGELPSIERGGEKFVLKADVDAWEPHTMTAAGADFTNDEARTFVEHPS